MHTLLLSIIWIFLRVYKNIWKHKCEFFVFRYSAAFPDNLSIHTNQSMNGGIVSSAGVGASYVDYARDYYSPTLQNANNCLLQQLQRETPTYVWTSENSLRT